MPRAWLSRLLADLAADAPSAGAAWSPPGGGGLAALRRAPDLAVRRSRPEGGLASVEVTLAWLPGALAGVNREGLAAACIARPGAAGRYGAPAPLLVQDCLHRFAEVQAALDWCLRRPAGGRATLLFADARGRVGGVDCDGDARRALPPADGGLWATAEAGALREPPAAGGLEGWLRGAGDCGLVVLDAAARRLELRDADAATAGVWVAE